VRVRGGVLVGAAAAALLALPPAGAGTPPPRRVAAYANQYLPADVAVGRGTGLVLVNTDAVPHNVVHRPVRGKPRFTSDTIPTGRQAAVVGVERLAPGRYPYVCTLHPQMLGELTVTGTASISG
jgi:plastocyanin